MYFFTLLTIMYFSMIFFLQIYISQRSQPMSWPWCFLAILTIMYFSYVILFYKKYISIFSTNFSTMMFFLFWSWHQCTSSMLSYVYKRCISQLSQPPPSSPCFVKLTRLPCLAANDFPGVAGTWQYKVHVLVVSVGERHFLLINMLFPH